MNKINSLGYLLGFQRDIIGLFLFGIVFLFFVFLLMGSCYTIVASPSSLALWEVRQLIVCQVLACCNFKVDFSDLRQIYNASLFSFGFRFHSSLAWMYCFVLEFSLIQFYFIILTPPLLLLALLGN